MIYKSPTRDATIHLGDEMEDRKEIEIDAKDLRNGDFIIRAPATYKNNDIGVTGNWRVTVTRDPSSGKLGYQYGDGIKVEEGARWVPGVVFVVRYPRPEPESNEFGLVSP